MAQSQNKLPHLRNRNNGPKDSTEKPLTPPSDGGQTSTQPTSHSEQAPAIPPDQVRKLSGRVRRAIHNISQQCPTRLRAIIDRYPDLLAAPMAERGDVGLPRPLRRHPRNTERSTSGIRGDVLCFHIGNAVLAIQRARQGHEAPKLETRVKMLDDIAEYGPGNFRVYGSEAHGYTLVHGETFRQLREAGKGGE